MTLRANRVKKETVGEMAKGTRVSRWSRDSIADEILRRYALQEDLSYSGVLKENLALLRAASRHHGSWRQAVEYAGLNYEDVRRYRVWNQERIVERIRELSGSGADLSWRHVAITLDPSLAAAATKRGHFGNWRAAIEASGLDYDAIRRYNDWTDDAVLARIRERFAQGLPLNAKTLERDDVALITAARRRFPAWHRSLIAAGLDASQIVLRTPVEKV